MVRGTGKTCSGQQITGGKARGHRRSLDGSHVCHCRRTRYWETKACRRLRSIAQTRGWAPKQEAPECLRFPVPARLDSEGIELRFQTVEASLGSTRQVEVAEGQAYLKLALDPLSQYEQEGLARGFGVESEPMERRLADASLGNPSLLLSLIGSISPEARVATRHLSEPDWGELFDSVTCPAEWRSWARNAMQGLENEVGDWLCRLGILSCMGFDDCSMPHTFSGTHLMQIAALERRGLIVAQSGRFCVQSALWGEAIIATDDERFQRNAASILSDFVGESGVDSVACVRLALRSGRLENAQSRIRTAIDHLDETGTVYRELELLTSALRGGVRVDDDLILRCCKLFFCIGSQSGLEVPRPPDGDLSGPASFLYLWWLGGKHPREALEELRSSGLLHSEVEDLRKGSLFLQYSLSARVDPASSNLARLRSELGNETGNDVRTSLWETASLIESGALPEAADVACDSLVRMASLPVHDQMVLFGQFGVVFFLLGDLDRADECARKCYEISKACGLYRHIAEGLHVLAGVAYQDGNLSRVSDWNLRLLHESMTREEWDVATLTLTNLSLVKVQQGEIGSALATIRDAARMLSLGGKVSIDSEVLLIEILVLARAGQCDPVRFRRRVAEVSGVERAHFLSALGEAELARGHLGAGRRALAEAESLFRENQALDDVAATLADWALMESALDEESGALKVYSRLDSVFDAATPLTKVMIVLAEAEMAALGWLETDSAPDSTLSMLSRAQEIVEEKGLGYWSWRPMWRIAQVLRRRGEKDRSDAAYNEAFRRLRGVAESIADDSVRDRYLDLPGPHEFMEDLSRIQQPSRS